MVDAPLIKDDIVQERLALRYSADHVCGRCWQFVERAVSNNDSVSPPAVRLLILFMTSLMIHRCYLRPAAEWPSRCRANSLHSLSSVRRLAAQKVDGNYGKMWDVESGVLYSEQQLARYIANAASHEVQRAAHPIDLTLLTN